MANLKCLIVEDDELYSKVIKKDLEKAEVEVLEILKTGEEAISYSLANKKIDFIIMDIVLAGKISGIDAAKEIYKKKDVPIIFLSGYYDDELIDKLLAINADAYLQKPVVFQTFISIIKMCVQKRQLEKNLKKQKELLEMFFENAPVGSAYVEKNLSLKKANGYFFRLLGTDKSKLKKISELFATEDKAIFESYHKDLFLNKRKSANFVVTLNNPKKQKIQVNMNAIYDDDDRVEGIVMFLHDVSEQKFFEELKIEFKNYIEHFHGELHKLSGYLDIKIDERQHDQNLLQNFGISEREIDVVKHLILGLRPKDIAIKLNKSYETINNQIRSIYRKLKISSRIELLNFLRNNNIQF